MTTDHTLSLGRDPATSDARGGRPPSVTERGARQAAARSCPPGETSSSRPGRVALDPLRDRRPPRNTAASRRAFDGRALRQAGTLLGLSASTYAVALAAVTGLQAASDRAALAQVEPAQNALAELVARNERLEENLVLAGGAYRTTADLYDAIVAQLEALERDLSNLQKTAGDLSGTTKALPQRVALPRVSGGSVSVPPKVHATTGASGG